MSVSTHQQTKCLNNRKRKSKWSKNPRNYFSIIIDSYRSSAPNNKILRNNDYEDKYYEEEIPALKKDYDNHYENPLCIPRQGELIINGGFENRQDPFFGWVINSGVETIDHDAGELAHQGMNAARLGYLNSYAYLYQDVPGICPGLFYNLNFFTSAATEYGNSSIYINIDFLDHYKNLLDCPALQVIIPGNSLSSQVFTGFSNITQIPAPPEARFARICFEINTNDYPDRFIHLDDVSLVALYNPT